MLAKVAGAVLVSAALAGAPSVASAAILFTQGGATGDGPGGSGGSFFTSADSFSLDQDATIDKVTWLGLYINNTSGTPAPGISDSFTVRIFDHSGLDSNGKSVPGSSIHTLTAPGTGFAVQRTFTGNVTGAGDALFSYSIDLGAAGFQAMAGVTYWLAIQNTADQGGSQPNWAWRDGGAGEYALGNAAGNQWTGVLNGNTLGLQPAGTSGNRAFTLEGTPGDVVPEPTTAALITLAAMGIGLRRRQRQA